MAKGTRFLLWLPRIKRWSDAQDRSINSLAMASKTASQFTVHVSLLAIETHAPYVPCESLNTILASPAADIIRKNVLVVPASPKLSGIPNRRPHRNVIDAAQTRSLVPDRALAARSSSAGGSTFRGRVHCRRGGPGASRRSETPDAAREGVDVGVCDPLAYLAWQAAPYVQVQPVRPAADLAAVAGALAITGAGVRGERLKRVESVSCPAFTA